MEVQSTMNKPHGHQDKPLGMTVYSMPEAGPSLVADGQRTVKGRWKMIAVLLVCAAPVIASYFTYYVIRPEGRRNFGELINPQRPLPDQAAVDLSGQPANLRALKGQWLLVTVAGGGCDEVCTRHLYLQRQMRESLGKDKERLDRVWLISDDVPVAPVLLPALKDATVLRVPSASLASWLEPASGQLLGSHLYVVDPLGNWMMRFPAKLDLKTAANAKRDLERLMRASASWDEAGRTSKP
ncbi:MAG: hypothetical protein KA207_16490 [Burkholderiaceae bacterium]|nr:hypothetical protein [Burkholderiaceae bacterium]